MTDAEFRDGLFRLFTRRFGTVAEILVREILDCSTGKCLFHDLYDEVNSQRIEVKFSRVLKKHSSTITRSNVLECIKEAVTERVSICEDESENSKFDCNIQQIKLEEFDVLYYGLMFFDKVLIFKMSSNDISKHKKKLSFSDKQHKGNVGEGQFHIKPSNLKFHKDNFLSQEITYKEMLEYMTSEKKYSS